MGSLTRRPYHYILKEDHTTAPTNDLAAWARGWDERKHVRQDEIEGVIVSTIFLGLDHSIMGEGPPILFETMVFFEQVGIEEYCERYATWDEAVAGHRRIVRTVESQAAKDAEFFEKAFKVLPAGDQ